MKISGIYSIRNKTDNKIYIGQSRDIRTRLYNHKRSLSNGTHYNKYLQRAFNKYGEENFEFSIVIKCRVEELDEKEKYYIEKFKSMDPSFGYNLEGGGNVGKTISSLVREAKMGANNPMYGKKLSEEHLESLRMKNRANSSLLTEQDVAEIKRRLSLGDLESVIAKDFGVHFSTINKISNLKNWSWVDEHLNEAIKNRKSDRNKRIVDLEEKGYSRYAIAREVGCGICTVEKVLNKRSSFFKNSDFKKKRNMAIVADFENGMSKKEIMDKYKISTSVYVSVTKEAFNKRKEALKQKAVKMRNDGMSVKEISEKLGFHRTTITEWTKR